LFSECRSSNVSWSSPTPNEEIELESSALERLPGANEMATKKNSPRKKPDPDRDTMRAEYDFSSGVRGVTAKRYAEGANVVVIDPELTALFPTSESVNEALRGLASLAKRAGVRSKKRSA
jgi:hypothetical protein